jgi:hypothetical protein
MPEKEIGIDHLKELLLLLCRYPFEEKNRVTLSKLIGEVRDWNWMVGLINAHGIIALAAYNIREAGLEKNIPEDSMAVLDNGRRQSMVRNAWLTERWKEVNTILTNAGIKHVLLKGMALEHTLYEAKGLRQMTDNDILVKREDSFKAWYLLQKKGFISGLIKSPLFKKIIGDIGEHLPPLYNDGYVIEIHHRLYDPEHKGGNNFYNPFDDAIEVIVDGEKAWILPKVIQIKHLVDHFVKHSLGGDQQLRLYADIKLLDKTIKPEISDDFILNPQQINKVKYLKAGYKSGVNSIPVKYRLRFVFGDIFPSMKWMKKRYNCNTFKAVLHYPLRVGKLLWLI